MKLKKLAQALTLLLCSGVLTILPNVASAWWPDNIQGFKCTEYSFNVDDNGTPVKGRDQEVGAWYWTSVTDGSRDITGHLIYHNAQCYHDFGGGWFLFDGGFN